MTFPSNELDLGETFHTSLKKGYAMYERMKERKKERKKECCTHLELGWGFARVQHGSERERKRGKARTLFSGHFEFWCVAKQAHVPPLNVRSIYLSIPTTERVTNSSKTPPS